MSFFAEQFGSLKKSACLLVLGLFLFLGAASLFNINQIANPGFAANQNTIYLSPNCDSNQTNCYSVKATGAYDCGLSWTTSTAQVTLSSHATRQFTQADVGTNVWGSIFQCGAAQIGSGAPPQRFNTTILSVQSGTVATLSATPSGNCTAGGEGGCTMFWGDTDEAAAVNTWFAAVTNQPNCGGVGDLPAGLIFVKSAIVNTASPCVFGNSSADTFANYTIGGKGIGSTKIVPMPGFDATNCPAYGTGGCIFGTQTSQAIYYHDFSIDGGGGSPVNVSSGGASMISAQAGSTVENVGVEDFGTATANLYGIATSGINGTPVVLQNVVDINAGGQGNCNIGTWTISYYLYCAGNGFGQCVQFINGPGNVITYGMTVGWCYGIADVLVNHNGGNIVWYSYGDFLQAARASQAEMDILSGDIVYLNGTQILSDSSNTGVTSILNAGSVYTQNVMIVDANSGAVGISNSGFFDNQGNTSVTAATGYSGAGTHISSSAEAGTVTCSTSTATITYVGSYVKSPIVIIQDRTTSGAVTQTSISNTAEVVGCPGASDVLNFMVVPNPI